MRLYSELKRRNVFRVGAAYAVVAWLLIEIADTIFPRLGLPEWTVTLVIALSFLAFPLALFLAWAYEITPDGVRREASTDPDAPAPAPERASRKLDLVLIVLLLVAGGVYLADRVRSGTLPLASESDSRRAAEPLVVVLPFENLGRSEDEYFADGITDEIIQRLVRVEGVRVIARASAMRYKGTNRNLAEIAKELGVEYVLDGTVRWAHLPDGSSRVRISPQLLRMPDGAPLWAEAFEEPLVNVFDIQAAIAQRVVDTMGVTVLERDQGAVQSSPAASLGAYQQYLEGRFLIHNRFKLGGRMATEKAIDLFERALEADPQFAEAWGAKASALAILNSGTAGNRDTPFDAAELTAKTFAAADRATALNPHLAEPFAARAQAYMQQFDWIAAERQVQMAVEREPRHAATLVRYGTLLVTVGRSKQALEVLQTASRLDPVDAVTAHWLADALRNTGRLKESRAEAERSLQLGMLPSGIGIYAYYLLQKDWSGATKYLEENMRAQNIDPAFAPLLTDAVRDPTKTPAARAALEATARENPRFDRLMYSYLYDLQDPEPLFDVIDTMIERGDGMYAFWRMWEPQFAHLRNHPRFRAIAVRVGFVDYWRKFGWPDQCRPEKDSFICN